MLPDQKDLLDELGFVWRIVDGSWRVVDGSLESRGYKEYEKLVELKRKKGRSLGMWVISTPKCDLTERNFWTKSGLLGTLSFGSKPTRFCPEVPVSLFGPFFLMLLLLTVERLRLVG
jgi:hypothetical protein